MIDPGLRNRTVLVTGTNNPYGIGAAVAMAFAEVGARLALHYYSAPAPSATDDQPGDAFYRSQLAKDCGEVARNVERAGAKVDVFETDFNQPANVRQLFADVETACGGVDVLINNAATWSADTFVPGDSTDRDLWVKLWTDPPRPFSDATAVRQFVVNACAPALLMREFARRLVARGGSWGRIVNISTAGAECFPSEVSYGASKAALESYSRSAAWELGTYGITVNTIALGPVQTGWITPALERALVPTMALGRIGTPRDVADVVVFLSSEQSRWVTGQRIFVSGGHNALS